jgi:uncharacterized protein (UPF0332 family)
MNQEIAQSLYEQAMELWIRPEILERHNKGSVSLPVVLKAAQIIFGMDGSHTVRLNGEVKGKFIAKVKRVVEVGEGITYNDIEDLHLAERDPDDIDFGHLTLLSQGNDNWNISFSFEYSTDNVQSYLGLGKEFLDAAKTSLETSRRVALAMGMTASENLLKARLATSPLVDIKTKNHSGLIHLLGQFTQRTTRGKIKSEYNDAIKFFSKHFNGVRYNPNYPKIHKSTIKKNIRILERLHSDTQSIMIGIDARSHEQRQVKIKNYQKH